MNLNSCKFGKRVEFIFHRFARSHLVAVTVKDNLPFVDQNHTFTQNLNFLQNVSRQQNRLRLTKLLNQTADSNQLIRIQSTSRFIQNENFRIVQ